MDLQPDTLQPQHQLAGGRVHLKPALQHSLVRRLCLVRHFPEIEQLFENHKHLVWFNDPLEAAELMDYYAKNPDACQKIREAGRQLYFENHSARERILNMVDIVVGKAGEFRGYL